MRVLITGGAGFIGKKLARGCSSAARCWIVQLTHLTLFDVGQAEGLPADPRLEIVTGDITRPGVLLDLLRPGYDAVFHLAAVVSGAAEADVDLGYAVNLDGTRHLLDAIRAFAKKPRLVFASSCAVFGGEPARGPGRRHAPHPADLLRRAEGDGRAAGRRLPPQGLPRRPLAPPADDLVRPGKPNKAASTWASSIFREPLAGQEAVCPVTRETAMYILSPRRVIDALVHAIELPSEALGTTRHINLPGTTYTVAEMVDALERVAGKARHRPHPLGARRADPEDRRRLAAALRHAARRTPGLRGGRQPGRDRPPAHRRRAGRPVRRLSARPRTGEGQSAGLCVRFIF